MHDYNSRYINLQFSHLKQKPEAKGYAITSKSIIKMTQEAKTQFGQ